MSFPHQIHRTLSPVFESLKSQQRWESYSDQQKGCLLHNGQWPTVVATKDAPFGCWVVQYPPPQLFPSPSNKLQQKNQHPPPSPFGPPILAAHTVNQVVYRLGGSRSPARPPAACPGALGPALQPLRPQPLQPLQRLPPRRWHSGARQPDGLLVTVVPRVPRTAAAGSRARRGGGAAGAAPRGRGAAGPAADPWGGGDSRADWSSDGW